jgi:hypothetical protein
MIRDLIEERRKRVAADCRQSFQLMRKTSTSYEFGLLVIDASHLIRLLFRDEEHLVVSISLSATYLS